MLLNPPGGDKTFWDDTLKGFGLRLQGNAASWVIMYRSQGRLRKVTLAKADQMPPEMARALAKRKLAEIAQGASLAENSAVQKDVPASGCGACSPGPCSTTEFGETAPVPALSVAQMPTSAPKLDSRLTLGGVSWHRETPNMFADHVSSFSRVLSAMFWVAAQTKDLFRKQTLRKSRADVVDELDWFAEQPSSTVRTTPIGVGGPVTRK